MSLISCFHGVCGLPVSRFWRVSLSLVSWCLSYFALHFVFIAYVAFKLFHGVCRLQLVFTACVAFGLFSWPVSPSSWPFLACVAYKLFSWRVLPSGCFHGVCRLQGVFSAFAAFSLFLRRVSPSGYPFLACVAFTLVSWCLSYFALHFVFIARVAYNLPRHVPPSSCCHGVCRLKVSGISSFRRFQTSFYNVCRS